MGLIIVYSTYMKKKLWKMRKFLLLRYRYLLKNTISIIDICFDYYPSTTIQVGTYLQNMSTSLATWYGRHYRVTFLKKENIGRNFWPKRVFLVCQMNVLSCLIIQTNLMCHTVYTVCFLDITFLVTQKCILITHLNFSMAFQINSSSILKKPI